jgi:hypothetical protein
MRTLEIEPEDFARYEHEINQVQAEEQKDIDTFWEGFKEFSEEYDKKKWRLLG